MNTQLKKYATLSKKIALLMDEQSLLKEVIIASLQRDNLDKVESVWGKFTKSTRTSYQYSDGIKKYEEKLKLERVKEENSGKATKKQTQYLVFTPLKTPKI